MATNVPYLDIRVNITTPDGETFFTPGHAFEEAVKKQMVIRFRRKEVVQGYVQLGHLLREIKLHVPSSRWTIEMERYGLHMRTAQRAMQLARAEREGRLEEAVKGVQASSAGPAKLSAVLAATSRHQTAPKTTPVSFPVLAPTGQSGVRDQLQQGVTNEKGGTIWASGKAASRPYDDGDDADDDILADDHLALKPQPKPAAGRRRDVSGQLMLDTFYAEFDREAEMRDFLDARFEAGDLDQDEVNTYAGALARFNGELANIKARVAAKLAKGGR